MDESDIPRAPIVEFERRDLGLRFEWDGGSHIDVLPLPDGPSIYEGLPARAAAADLVSRAAMVARMTAVVDAWVEANPWLLEP